MNKFEHVQEEPGPYTVSSKLNKFQQRGLEPCTEGKARGLYGGVRAITLYREGGEAMALYMGEGLELCTGIPTFESS